MTSRLPEEVVPDNDQTRARREHLSQIEALVGNAYPNKFVRTSLTKSAEGEDTITSVVGAFRTHEPAVEEGERPAPEQLEKANAALKEVGSVRISGRLATPPRVMGKVAFVHLSDGKERLQIYVRKQEARAISNDSLKPVEEPESGWKLLDLLDHGDFVGVEGRLFVTKTGELSVHVETIQFLSKALLPMPDKLHGISDPEIRQRQRYADLIASSLKVKTEEESEAQQELSTRRVFELRSKLISSMRRHLDDHGYIEVETPMLSPIASGAAARPFVTHHNALDLDLYLRIAPELYLKRLLVGGFERVYELNRNFRNEGISTRHNPEFTMLEFYTAYKDVNWMMDFCEEMLRTAIKMVAGTTLLDWHDKKVDFSDRIPRITMKDAVIERFKELGDESCNFEEFKSPEHEARFRSFLDIFEHGVPGASWELRDGLEPDGFKLACQRTFGAGSTTSFVDDATHARQLADAFGMHVEPYLEQPTFITGFPKIISPLSKAAPDEPLVAERFELYVGQMEVANGFSELNDPAEQLERFEEQARQREGGDEEAMQTDLDYVRALSYGMPPAAGIGIGIDRLTMLLTNRRSIRDVILFPHMRPRQAAESQEQSAGQPSDS